MKGHLGHRCRACLVPTEPQNLRQSGNGTVGASLTATLAWDAPAAIGSGEVLEYVVETTNDPAASPVVWTEAGNKQPNDRSIALSFCREQGAVRVAARNRCGLSQWATFSGFTFTAGTTTHLYTASGTISPPCWATSMKVWCVGKGSVNVDGGDAGGVAWKTWTNVAGLTGSATITVRNSVLEGAEGYEAYPLSRVVYDGTTVTGYGGGANFGNGGDGQASGGSGARSAASASFSSVVGFPWTGRWYFSGALGGGSDYYEERAVSPCMRIPAKWSALGGLSSAVADLGLDNTEGCDSAAAFGSGGTRIPIAGLNYNASDYYFQPSSYGAGGFDSLHPAGVGCVVVKYS